MTRRFEVPDEKIPSLGERVFLNVVEKFLVLFNIDGQFYAIDDSCPHQGASLFSGKLDGCTIQCCAHGLRFNLTDGYMVNSTQLKVPSYTVETEGEQLFIRLGEGA
ncbi:Rieske 2Fe-2S domain-containing protein [Acinetobacter sp. RF15A]|uniref:Rieske (2Fe-2S) protein n=1 Tax=unclassified Acinetobacter TaxID=196816 RepID=UPI00118F2603|nr:MULTISPECIES: Rieske 2Fe-2S domain-containing protein [unclassified Acinetobacter]TSH73066.1 Rieske 2Fe-2S domain-containing protein [Acinetobacter sp. RF15A]TSI15727.1 Rieske 2Fe-2S domain-containing protein [Acinetobacter sp. RF15B]